ncbi:hypothetical protein D3C84_430020 [compost metagenome]
MWRSNHFDRRTKRVEAFISEHCGNVSCHTTAGSGFVNNDDSTDLLCELDQRVFIERRSGTRINHTRRNAIRLKFPSSFFSNFNHSTDGNDHHILTIAYDLGFTERHSVRTVGYFTHGVVQHLVLQENDRVIITHSLKQQAFSVVRVRRYNNFQPWEVRENRVERLGMLCCRASTSAVGSTDHQRSSGATAEHISELRDLVDDLV